MTSLSASNRIAIRDTLKSKHFDLLVIGGGITGAGIILDAASRGLKVALIEKNDFAFGTSSRSTKLIHGGLRYLKQLEFGLVKEVGSERAVVHKLAPHLVIPEKMLLPLYERRGLGSLLTSVGLMLYDWLAGVKPEDQRKMLTRHQTLKQEPLLHENDVKGGAIYAEYRTDDARLTVELMKTAVSKGADVLNYCRAVRFKMDNGKLCGLLALDEWESIELEINASCIVNAAGPWVDELREMDQSKTGKTLHLTKGVHIVVPYEKLPIRQAIYFDVEEDGRMIFAIPRGRTTYIGTTDTNYTGSLEEVCASKEDAVYLLRAVNKTFQFAPLELKDIESSWAGLRPLIHEEGKSESELSRKDEIFESPSGLISIAGGKLTGYRKMAERTVDKVIKKYFPGREFRPCFTDRISLKGSDFASYEEVKKYIALLSFDLRRFGLEGVAPNLVHTYGKQSEKIVEILESRFKEDKDMELVRAELDFCFHYELITKPLDFLMRRTGMIYFDRPRFEKVYREVIRYFSEKWNWPEARQELERKEVERLLSQSHQL